MSSPGRVGVRSPEEQRQYLAEQIGEMLGPFNRWVAGLTLKHPPTDSEAAKHYVDHGGAEDFARRHSL